MRYHDPRRFGLAIVTHADELANLPQLRHLGVDPFAETLSGEYLFRFTRASERRIRDLLLDQQSSPGWAISTPTKCWLWCGSSRQPGPGG